MNKKPSLSSLIGDDNDSTNKTKKNMIGNKRDRCHGDNNNDSDNKKDSNSNSNNSNSKKKLRIDSSSPLPSTSPSPATLPLPLPPSQNLNKNGQIVYKLFVNNLDQRISEAGVIRMCQQFGKVSKVDMTFHHSGPRRGQPRGFCFVEFVHLQNAQAAIMGLNHKKVFNRSLDVRWFDPNTKNDNDNDNDNDNNNKNDNTKSSSSSSDTQTKSNDELIAKHKNPEGLIDYKLRMLKEKLKKLEEEC